MAAWWLSPLLPLLLLLAAWAHGNSVEQKIYVELKDTAACVRLMNGTHQIGCQSSVGGDTGVLHLVSGAEDLAWVLKDGPHSPYMALLDNYMFSRETMMQLKVARGRVAGVVVMLHQQEAPPVAPVNFSHDLSCPNDKFGVYEDTDYAHCRRAVWNPSGSGLALEDFSFPVFLLRDANETSAVLQCVRDHNVPINATSKVVDYPLCAIQLKSHMHGVRDTVTCMRRSNLFNNLNPELVCDSLGDYNVLGVLQPINQSMKGKPDKDIIIAAARLDSRSFFWNVTSGADSAASGFVTLLAAAEALAALGNASRSLPRNVLFLFLQGEAFDYIGSSRFVYDIMRNKSFLSLDSIHSFLEISQVGLRDGATVWAHSDPISRQVPQVNESVWSMVEALRAGGLTVATPDPEQPLPPSSLQRFLRHRNLSGVVLAEHRTAFHNQYYHSVYDVAPNIKLSFPEGLTPEEELTYPSDIAKNLTELATGVARALYLQAGGDNETMMDIQANTTTVARLLYTLLVRANNSWLRSIMDKENKGILGRHALSFYVGVSDNWSHNDITQVALHALANLTGTAMPLNETACRDPKKHGVADEEMFKYIWVMGSPPGKGAEAGDKEGAGFCTRSTAHLSPAVSPAFELRDFDSGEYSTWTESRWKQLRARLFLVASPQLEHVTLAVGCLVLALSLCSVYLVNSKADVLFTPTRDAHSPAY
ncbi:nicastrin [Lethenteron reissneri]|uniref:nicastrin n=1 Tax=Lethenteron reissneri TaxID=7753 RepID=UPI002AB5EEF3|nr:nicastrin [Lethenteron reissneri]